MPPPFSTLNRKMTVVEGETLIGGERVGHGRTRVETKTVEVTDGRMTMTSHDRHRNDVRTRINSIEIRRK